MLQVGGVLWYKVPALLYLHTWENCKAIKKLCLITLARVEDNCETWLFIGLWICILIWLYLKDVIQVWPVAFIQDLQNYQDASDDSFSHVCCFCLARTQDLDRIAEANELFDAVLTGSVDQDKKATKTVAARKESQDKDDAKTTAVNSQKGGNSQRRFSLYIGNFPWVSDMLWQFCSTFYEVPQFFWIQDW